MIHNRIHLLPTALLPVILLPALTCVAADWPHWRGPNRNDITSESSGWKAGKPWLPAKPAWRINLGKGCGSPIVVGERIYTMGWKNNKDHVYCHHVVTGKEIWTQTYPCAAYGRKANGDQRMYAGPSSTPEYDIETGYLYTLSVDGDLICWNTKQNGKKVWGINLYEQFDVPQRPRVGRSGLRDYGYTTSPLVKDDWLLVEVGAKQGSVMAFNKRNGKQIWSSQIKEPGGHTGGVVLMEVEGKPCLAVLTHFHLAVMRLDKGREGETIATYPWVTEFANSIATPAVHENCVLLTSAYNHFTICKLAISLDGAKRVWEKKYPSGVCSPIIHDGHVYLAWRKARCLNFQTGEEKWSGGNTGSAGSCILTADEKLIVWCSQGTLMLVETAEKSPNQYTVLEQRNLSTDIAWPHVVLSGGRLYCKDRNGELFCFVVGS